MRGSPAVAVQIVSYRTRNYLERCLSSATSDLTRSGIDHEISVLNNDPAESLADLARRIPGCRTLDAPRNLGFGAGQNLLAAHARAPYLLILNPDVEFLHANTVKRLLAVLTERNSVKVVGPKLMTAEGAPQVYDHGRLHGLRAQISVRGGHSYWRASNRRREVAWVSGAAMLLDRAAFEEVGGFDERFFLYKEDEDLCLRMRDRGWQVIYEPAARLLHHGSVIAERGEDLRIATSYYLAKHFPNQRLARAFAAAHRGLAHLRR